jgi:hypothetical protein
MMLFICEHRDSEGDEDCEEPATLAHFVLDGYPGAEVTPMCEKHKCDECMPLAEALFKQTSARYGGYDLIIGFKKGEPFVLNDERDGELGQVSREYFGARLDLELTSLAYKEAREKEKKNRRDAAAHDASLPHYELVDPKKKKH